jgi:hypothetical protein
MIWKYIGFYLEESEEWKNIFSFIFNREKIVIKLSRRGNKISWRVRNEHILKRPMFSSKFGSYRRVEYDPRPCPQILD